ncbi:SLOG family protein [Enterococcus bulliens]
MTQAKTIFISGYRNYEIGIFQEKDPKIAVIKKSLKSTCIQLIEEGATWFVISGSLGVELWAAQVILELKQEYEVSLAVISAYTEFFAKWNEQNQQAMQTILEQADFVDAVSRQPYTSPQQLKNHTQFVLAHTMGCVLVYDPEYPGKSQFFIRDATQYQECHSYEILYITMDDLQNAAYSD